MNFGYRDFNTTSKQRNLLNELPYQNSQLFGELSEVIMNPNRFNLNLDIFRIILATILFRRYILQTFDYQQESIVRLYHDKDRWRRILTGCMINERGHLYFRDFLNNIYQIYLIHFIRRNDDDDRKLIHVKASFIREHMTALNIAIEKHCERNIKWLMVYLDFLMRVRDIDYNLDRKTLNEYVNEQIYDTLFDVLSNKIGDLNEDAIKIIEYFEYTLRVTGMADRLLLKAFCFDKINHKAIYRLLQITATLHIDPRDQFHVRTDINIDKFIKTSKEFNFNTQYYQAVFSALYQLYDYKLKIQLITQDEHKQEIDKINDAFVKAIKRRN